MESTSVYAGRDKAILAFMLFLSGACGLVYEVTWCRMLIPVLGSSTEAVTAVLSAFMGGLCLGSYLAARWGDRMQRPLLWYGSLEIGIGVSSLITIFLLPSIGGGLVWFGDAATVLLNVYRFTSAMALMCIPTIAMGATLPVLSRFVNQVRQQGGGMLGALFGFNTLGAAVGVLLAGFVLLPILGARSTTYTAIAANCFVGVVCLTLYKNARLPKLESTDSAELPTTSPETEHASRWIIPLVFAISGMCAMGMQVIWTRLLIFFLSANCYVFSSILTTLLAGMALGSLLGSRLARRVSQPEVVFSLLIVLLGITGLTSLWGALGVPAWRVTHLGENASHTMVIVSWILSAAVVVLPSALLMGAVFPFAVASYVEVRSSIVRRTGNLCCANTLGATFGPVLTGLILIPWLGSQMSLTLLATLLVASGTFALARTTSLPKKQYLALGGSGIILFALVFLLVPRDVCRHVYDRYAMSHGELIALVEGRNGVVTVHREAEGNALSVNGLREVPPDLFSLQTFRLLGHLPMMFHPEPRQVLTVAFGSGTALGSVLCWPVDTVTCVEICESVPKMESHFEYMNWRPLDDSRLCVVIDDARNYLQRTRERYDVITSDATHPRSGDSWVLYTKEYYELCRDHLTEKGIMAQWVPMHGLPGREFERVLGTFSAVFPHCALFAVPGHTVVLGSQAPIETSLKAIEKRCDQPKVRQNLFTARYSSISEVLASFVCGEDEIRRRSAELALNSDNLPYTAYSDRGNTEGPAQTQNMHRVMEMQQNIWGDNFAAGTKLNEWQEHLRARSRLFEAFLLMGKGENKKAYDLLVKLRQDTPSYGTGAYLYDKVNDQRTLYLAARVMPIVRQALQLIRAREYESAKTLLEQALEMWPENGKANLAYAGCLTELGQLERAERHAIRASEADPDDPALHAVLARIRHLKSIQGEQ